MGAQRTYAEEPGLANRVFDLLEEPFPGVSAARRQAADFGAPWEEASTPFVVEVGGELVAHVGLLELSLRVEGCDLVAGGVHGVVTRGTQRRRGHFRAALEELVEVAADRYPTLVLTTQHPEYFAPFGFRVLPELVFSRQLDHPGARGRPARRLDPGHDADRRLLHRLLAAVVAAWDGPVERVVAFFSPDRLGAAFEAVPLDLAGGPDALEPREPGTALMCRGPLPGGDRPRMLPRAGRC